MSKRPHHFSLKEFGQQQEQKLKKQRGAASAHSNLPPHATPQERAPLLPTTRRHPYLDKPIVDPQQAVGEFLRNVRSKIRELVPDDDACRRRRQSPLPFEVEARFGILHNDGRRVLTTATTTSSNENHVSQGSKPIAYDCSTTQPQAIMQSGVSHRHFKRWTSSGISKVGPIAMALGASEARGLGVLEQRQTTETIYTYSKRRRLCFNGLHPENYTGHGKLESKEKKLCIDLAIPTAPYDVRVALSTEKVVSIVQRPLESEQWGTKRVKRRWSYRRRDNKIAWQIDVTQVTTVTNPANGPIKTVHDYEIEMELRQGVLIQLVNENDPGMLNKIVAALAREAWEIVKNMNPLSDGSDAEDFLCKHPSPSAVQLSLAQCESLRNANVNRTTNGSNNPVPYGSPIGNPQAEVADLAERAKQKFVGCMPVSCLRANLHQIQKLPDSAYYCTEKTDGVRYLLVVLENTAVLVDRNGQGKQPIPSNPSQDPFASIVGRIQPGTVLDGEVVLHRSGNKPRPIFIVFDVLSLSTVGSIMHMNFQQRLDCLEKATFCKSGESHRVFAGMHSTVPLPLVRKTFVRPSQIGTLLDRFVEERGMRIYSDGVAHKHATDGLIFQPNAPYKSGMDLGLFKWKFLDTITIDLQIEESQLGDPPDALRLSHLGGTRFAEFPKIERLRLEADKHASGRNIVEVGKDPDTGDWYYVMFRVDKTYPNGKKAVDGARVQLEEKVTVEELRKVLSGDP